MKTLLYFTITFLLAIHTYGQKIYQIRADSVRIYNVCDTAELIIENRTQQVSGFLFNKGAGRTEFKKLKLSTVGTSEIAIAGQDTLDLSTLPGIGAGAGGGRNIYTSDGILTGNRKLTGNQRSYGLGFDSLTNFSAQANILALSGNNPIISNNSPTSIVLQSGQSNWRAFSNGTVRTNVQVEPSRFLVITDNSSFSVTGDNDLRPGIILDAGVYMNFISVGSSYKLTAKDYFVAVYSQFNNVTITLPDSKGGRILVIKKVMAANSVTVTCSGTGTIDGQPTKVLTASGEVVRLIGDGSGWYIY
ncbi:hypothetical protein ACE38W_15945 [Chitinophaga sp. Hz27]|uniref:hypothetical protein n=1 Tax=Chitinophaga sp. Hz27 TaxID=3347169 RepID=UPI0035DE825C